MKRLFQYVALIIVSCILVGCGEKSQEDVIEKLAKTIGERNYDVKASMEICDNGQTRKYNIEAWHTKPAFYKVQINELDSGESQIIIKNDEGVFLQSPTAKKTYKFQTDWPEKNSQSYLISTIVEDIRADEKAVMKTTETHYIFEAATRNSSRTGLTSQQVMVDKKTFYPTQVTLLDNELNEKIKITFSSVDLNTKHKPEEYALQEYKQDESLADSPFKVKYPTVTGNSNLIDEMIVAEKGNERAILSYKGEKSFTLIQYPIPDDDKIVTVSVKGDPEWIGSTYAAIDENTLTWEENGVAFLLTSDELDPVEMVKIATSLATEK